jgi:hypothetical protein
METGVGGVFVTVVPRRIGYSALVYPFIFLTACFPPIVSSVAKESLLELCWFGYLGMASLICPALPCQPNLVVVQRVCEKSLEYHRCFLAAVDALCALFRSIFL